MKQKSQYLWKHLKFLLYSTKQNSTYQIIKNPCNENNVNITYQVMGRQSITQNIIYENL